MTDNYQTKYNQSNSNNQFVDTAQSGSTQNFTQNIESSEKQKTLAQAAQEIQDLLQQLEQSYPNDTSTDLEIKVIQQIQNNANWKQRLINAGKQGGLEFLKKSFDNPVGGLIIAAIEGWINADMEEQS